MDTSNEVYVVLVLAFMVFYIFYMLPDQENFEQSGGRRRGERRRGERRNGRLEARNKNFKRNNRYGSTIYTKPYWLYSNYHPYFNVYYDFFNPWSVTSKDCTFDSLEKCKDNYYHEACFDSKYNECLREKTMFQSYYF